MCIRDRIVPFQVLLELNNLKKKMNTRVKNVMKTLKNQSNIFYQSAQTKNMYQRIFHVKSQDHDGYILAAALFLKVCIPFRKVILLSKDKAAPSPVPGPKKRTFLLN